MCKGEMYFSYTRYTTGPNTPIKIEAKGSTMTAADAPTKIPVFI